MTFDQNSPNTKVGPVAANAPKNHGFDQNFQNLTY
jgi:hypothetical protein